MSTVNPGDPAAVTVSVSVSTLHFSFALPRGNDGQADMPGSNGTNGSEGGPGPPRPQGPSFGSPVVDGVTTLAPGDPATAGASFDGTYLRFTFSIPLGNDGIQGPPGEVSNAQLITAIAGTSNLSNAVATLGMTVSDPPTQAEVQAVASKLDELITALRR